MKRSTFIAVSVTAMSLAMVTLGANAQGNSGMNVEKQRVIDHWTAERRAAATPRDMRIDGRGLAYMRARDGSLKPYGHQIEAQGATRQSQQPMAKPGGAGNRDTTPPQISSMNPLDGATIGASASFSATVTDDFGVRSVDIVIRYPDGTTTQTFAASNTGGDTWGTTLQGFTDGDWSWYVEATDTAKRGGNSSTSAELSFTVSGGGGGGGGGGSGTITNSEWDKGGVVQGTVGRLFYEMPSNRRWKRWNGYVCSGTVVNDGAGAISVILTAAHCVFDDANGAFARNVLFIPDQANTTGSGTDSNCDNDPMGCWVAAYGVVDSNWTQTVFPNNVEWDSAYYVVDDSGSHSGTSAPDALDAAVTPMSIDWSTPVLGDMTHAIGYSYSYDPQLRYCAEEMTTEGSVNWWLASCELSGGSSGGPWVQPLAGSNGPIISVNSWGYTTSAGMAGPKLSEASHRCVFDEAALGSGPRNAADGEQGVVKSCP